MNDTAPRTGHRRGFARLPFGDDALAFAEQQLNARIQASTAARTLVDELDGRSFAVEVLGTGLTVVLTSQGGRATLAFGAPAPTVTLRATPFDLVRLAGSATVADLKGTTAELTGHLHTAEQFAELLKHARPDLEEELSHWIGDVAAHGVGRAAANASAWLRRAAGALRMNSAEFLQEESRTLPAPLEAQAFFRDVERLRDDVERAAARLARLEGR